MSLQEKYPGLEHVHVGCNRMGASLEVMLEQLDWIAKDVMPVFKKQAVAA
jgi:hypothetical protein